MAQGKIDEHSSVEEIRAAAIAMVIKARSLGYNVAADCLEAYINLRISITLSPQWLRSFSKVTDAENVNDKRFEDAIQEYGRLMKSKTQKNQRYAGDIYHWDRLISYQNR